MERKISDSKNLGDWIRSKYGNQDGLAEKLKVSVATVSAYKTGRINIPPKVQEKIRSFGYEGPWPREELAQEPAGGAITAEAFHRTVGQLEGRIGVLERAFEKLGEAVRELAIRDKERAEREGR